MVENSRRLRKEFYGEINACEGRHAFVNKQRTSEAIAPVAFTT